MPKLRRSSSSANPVPAAAEVLEMRSLLSSAAGVAAAVGHHLQHSLTPQASPTLDFSGTRTGHLSAPIFGAFNNVAENFTANFATGTGIAQVGKSITSNFTAPINSVHNGYTIVSMSGHISGRLTGSFFQQNTEVFFVHATSSLTLNVIYQGTPMALKISPKGGVAELEVTFQHQFVSLLGKYSLPKKIFNGDEFIFNFS